MQKIRSIASIGLAVWVLVAASSFTVHMHVCGGSVQSVSLFEKAKPCPMEANTAICHKDPAKRNSCCNDEQLTYEGQDFKLHELTECNTLQQPWVAAIPIVAYIVPASTSFQSRSVSFYKPPSVQHNIPVLLQSFLI
ncbi:MAG: hypothetical protein KF775_04730 [Cyclobacteriaceae bacterium]|nr:hypothetical protein [Cyclobacteriaceae bacterium]